MVKLFFAALSGTAAGFVNGFLGTGGGIILIYTMRLFKNEINEKDVLAITLTVTPILSAFSLWSYGKNGNVDAVQGLKYGLTAIPGGLLGAYLLDKLDGDVIKKIFAALLIFAGINMAGII